MREGYCLNRKKVQRLWREEGLRVPPKHRKRARLGTSTTPADRLAATSPDHVWALDYQFDVTATGRVIKILHVVDEFTRESLCDVVDHSIDADATVAALDKIVGARGTHPRFIRCDNGPELTANALRDWCRFGGAGTSYIDPGSPWQNPWVESYGSRMRDELLAIEQFDTMLEAQVLVADWRAEYNDHRPHSALGGCSLRPSSLGSGGPTIPSSHSGWTDDWGRSILDLHARISTGAAASGEIPVCPVQLGPTRQSGPRRGCPEGDGGSVERAIVGGLRDHAAVEARVVGEWLGRPGP